MNFSSCANDNDYQKQTQVITVIICRIILVLSLTHLAGCSETPSRDAEWQEYLQRLTANLNQPQQDFLVAESLQTWQTATGEVLPDDNPTISLVEFWQLKPCELHQTIAERNSSLGRFQQPSQQLLYELAVIEQIPACAQIIEAEHGELAAELRLLRSQKLNDLPVSIYQATINGPEWAKLHSNLQSEAVNVISGLDALRQLAGFSEQWREGDFSQSRSQVEALLGQVYHSNAASYLLRFAQRELAFYQLANQALSKQLSSAPLCLQTSPTRRARQFQGIVSNYFNKNIQQPANQTLQQWRELNEVLSRIESSLPGLLSSQQNRYIQHRSSVQNELIDAQRAHASMASEMLTQCGLAVNAG